MKRILSAIAALALLFACSPESINPEGNDNTGNDNGGSKEVVATAIKLNKNEIKLEKGGNETLTVTFTPSNTTNKALTWVSSNKSIAEVTDGIVVGVDVGSTEIIVKNGDLTDKCTVTVVISAKGISLDKSSVEFVALNQTKTLVATVEPATTTDIIEWESSDKTVVTVENGLVTAVGSGTAKITAKVGEKKAECSVSVSDVAVDLGIIMTREDGTTYKLYWAKSNLCEDGLCANPEDFGDYYAWGETVPYYAKGHSQDNPCSDWRVLDGRTVTGYDYNTYKWITGDFDYITKYCTDDDWAWDGHSDNKTVLDPEDDVAHVVLGGNWRIATVEEWTELFEKCTLADWSFGGSWGEEFGWYLYSAPNGNSIFFPIALERHEDKYGTFSYEAYYWTSSLCVEDPFAAYIAHFEDSRCGSRYYGFSVRPVYED